MKKFILTELLLVSPKEKTARRLKFDKKLTVIQGQNDTGKSSVIKSIYHTFGATPPNVHSTWEAIKVIALARFTLDGTSYAILRDGTSHTIFDENDKVLDTFNSVTKGLGPYFANLFNFHLPLSTRDSETQATPAFLFLPFYIDQDNSWTNNWNSFANLSQFANWRNDVVNFHAGVRPSEYYITKSKLSSVQFDSNDLEAKRRTTTDFLKRVEKKLSFANFNIDIEAYKKEITGLLDDCNSIRSKQQKLRRTISDLLNQRHLILSQIELTKMTAEELGNDLKFANEKLGDAVECPTCGAGYDNSFAERFAIAEDEDRCRELIRDLESELAATNEKLVEVEKKSTPLKEELDGLNRHLNKKRGQVRLKDLIENEGKREVRQLLEKDIDGLSVKIGKLEIEADGYRNEMKRYDDRKKKKEIKEFYLSRMSKHLRTLKVLKLEEKTYSKLNCKIKETGSDLPRGLLAYYFAFLQTVNKYSTCAFCPIVIDSPKQQDQDQGNYKKIINFLVDNQPEDSQMIIGLVDTADIDLPGKKISFNVKYHALKKSQYKRAIAEVRNLLDARLAFVEHTENES